MLSTGAQRDRGSQRMELGASVCRLRRLLGGETEVAGSLRRTASPSCHPPLHSDGGAYQDVSRSCGPNATTSAAHPDNHARSSSMKFLFCIVKYSATASQVHKAGHQVLTDPKHSRPLPEDAIANTVPGWSPQRSLRPYPSQRSQAFVSFPQPTAAPDYSPWAAVALQAAMIR